MSCLIVTVVAHPIAITATDRCQMNFIRHPTLSPTSLPSVGAVAAVIRWQETATEVAIGRKGRYPLSKRSMHTARRPWITTTTSYPTGRSIMMTTWQVQFRKLQGNSKCSTVSNHSPCSASCWHSRTCKPLMKSRIGTAMWIFHFVMKKLAVGEQRIQNSALTLLER